MYGSAPKRQGSSTLLAGDSNTKSLESQIVIIEYLPYVVIPPIAKPTWTLKYSGI
jgi:hypothetical protein